MDNNTVYEWILDTFAASARARSLQRLEPHLATLVRPGDRVLDICCGAGPLAFWLEAQGANVTAIDLASYMITLAREEASRRNSRVEFIEADILKHELGWNCFDLITCYGNSISDFPVANFARLGKKAARALKPGGRFAVEYHDGSYAYMQGQAAREGMYQETPERIGFRFKEYLPEIGACVKTIRNESRGEAYDRNEYIYTVPMVHLAMSRILEREQHVVLDENDFLDVFVKVQ